MRAIVTQSDPSRPSSSARPLRVLIVDDHLSNRIVAETLIEKAGYQPIPVGSGEEAIALLEREWVDVVVVDLYMPGLGGLDVVRWIRNKEATDARAPIPIVLLTGDASATARQQAFDSGASEVLTKPIPIKDLVQHIGAFALHGSRAATPPPATPGHVGLFLEDLRATLSNDAAFASYLANAINDAKASLRSLGEAITVNDAHAALCAAHALKGLCSNLGLDRMAAECERIEQSCGRGEAAWLHRDALLMLQASFEAGLQQIDAKFGPELHKVG